MINDEVVDPEPISVSFPCIRARQPIGDIYIASMSHKTVSRITYFDVRRVLQVERDFERYLGIQRPLDPRRVHALESYVNFTDASFPTSVIVAIPPDYTAFDADKCVMTLSNMREGEDVPSIAIGKLARVLDGQHRVAGLAGFKGERFDLSVTIFIGADIADQAQIFATVNLEQTKVNKSLVYDLYELSKSRSPQKTCHNAAVILDRDKDSPLFKRIKRLGIGTEGRVFEPISQATFVEGLLPYITKDAKADRDTLLRGKRLRPASNEELNTMPLRNMFVAERDLDIAQIIFNYFAAVRNRWPTAWDDRRQGKVLNRTNGVRALLRFFRIAYLHATQPGEVPSVARFENAVFSRIRLTDQHFDTQNFVPGSGGETRLYNALRGRVPLDELVEVP